MDTLSIAASSVAIVASSAQIIYRLKAQLEGTTIAIYGLRDELEALREVLQVLEERLSHGDIKHNIALLETLQDCASTLQRMLDTVENATAKRHRKLFMLHSSRSTIQPLLQKLERLRLALRLYEPRKSAILSSDPEQILRYSTTLNTSHVGLRVLSSPEISSCDIIFVHGLNGHPERTWQWTDVPRSREVLWLRDFLGRDVPDARICTYGYDSRKFSSTDRVSVADTAELLAAAMMLERRNAPVNRPIIWVAHSYGGLIIKSALEHSWRHNDLNNPQGLIFNATIGIVFLATPHRAGTAPAWTNTIDCIDRITDPLGWGTTKAKPLSAQQDDVFQYSPSSFSSLIGEGRISVFSFFEKSPINTQWGPMIISDITTALGHHLEHVNYLEGNHLTVCKFQDDSEPGYMKIRSAINEIRDEFTGTNQMALTKPELGFIKNRFMDMCGPDSTITSEYCSSVPSNDESLDLNQSSSEQRKKFLRVLNVFSMERNVTTPRDLGSCNWILEDKSFKSWLQSSTISFFHLTGSPGSGKTILANFIIDFLQGECGYRESSALPVNKTNLGTMYSGTTYLDDSTMLNLAKNEADNKIDWALLNIKPSAVIYFFFERKQGTSLAISDLLRLFISQLLNLNPRFMRYVPQRQLHRHRRSKNRRRISMKTDDLEELLDVLLSMLRDPESQPTFCVMDGVDECDSASVPWVTRLLEQLHINLNVKVLLTSRPLVISMSNTNMEDSPRLRTFKDLAAMLDNWGRQRTLEVLDIAQTEGLAKDLQRFIQPRLKQLAISHGLSYEVRESLEKLLLRGHENGFIGVMLLLQIIGNLTSMRLVKNFLNEIESNGGDLDTLYRKVCSTVEALKSVGEVQPSIFKVLSLLIYAMRPLKIDDLAMALSLHNKPTSLDDVLDDKPLWFNTFLKNQLGHLLEFEQGTVSLKHSTFKYFIEEQLPVEEFEDHDPSIGHFKMAQSCLTMLSLWKNSQRNLSVQEDRHYHSNVPFLDYALNCWVDHLQDAGKLASQLNGLLLKLWNSRDRKRIFLDFLYSRPPDIDEFSSSLPFVLAAIDLPYNIIALEDHKRASGEDLRLLLNYAKRHSSAATIDILIEDARERNEIVDDSPIHTIPDVGPESLLRAIKWQKTDVVKSILYSGMVEIKEEKLYNAVLEEAVNVQNRDLITLLLDDFKLGSFGTSLHIAARNANSEICTLLLSYGADCDARDGKEQTALHIAAKRGQLKIVNLLIDWRAEPSFPDDKGRRPIHRAAEEGYSEIVKFFMRIVPYTDEADERGRTPLYCACQAGQIVTVQQLLRYGSNINSTDKKGRTALHAATIKGIEGLVRLLLNNGSDPNAKDQTGRTPLHEAALYGWDSVVELLLLSGADSNSKDDKGRSPLHYGCQSTGYPENSIRMLLEAGGYVETQDINGRTPLHYAAYFSNAAIVTQISDLQGTVDTKDKQGNTALHAAACRSDSFGESIMKALIRSGSDKHLPNAEGKTPADCLENREALPGFQDF